ncbi:hypothetical protein CAPTEDRAFT_190418 [Capitella teleta]|uniref:Uncharacterized protein n=1 Tax=Capitella teleta TaxID=283909 RepID=R7T832_CAPTE|nr:hypothetical protein CAPTEDRAFT_190418 [Capitella teleta]|eukprot:ELT89613.1 hypothetical protein CAPTEDRAFT_190418 [Capitella teleta]
MAAGTGAIAKDELEGEKKENVRSSFMNHVMKQYSENTTFHGVKQIFEDQSAFARRLSWTLVVLGSIVGFSYAISIKLIHFLEYPSQIDLTVTYEDSLEFPTVYICNPNPYQMSKVMRHGLLDVVAAAYRTEDKHSEGVFVFKEGICDLNFPLDDVVLRRFRYMTLGVCQSLCHGYYKKCSGIFYNVEKSYCYLTSTTGAYIEPLPTESCFRRPFFLRRKRHLIYIKLGPIPERNLSGKTKFEGS